MLAYLARYTHRVAISNSRLIALDQAAVTFKWKDYRIKGPDRLSTMTLDADPKIPIGRAAPNQTAPFPTRGFLLTRLWTPARLRIRPPPIDVFKSRTYDWFQGIEQLVWSTGEALMTLSVDKAPSRWRRGSSFAEWPGLPMPGSWWRRRGSGASIP